MGPDSKKRRERQAEKAAYDGWRTYTGVAHFDATLRGFRDKAHNAKFAFPTKFWELRQCYDEFTSIASQLDQLSGDSPREREKARECIARFIRVEWWAKELADAAEEALRENARTLRKR